jgi:hypothetical protein
MEAVCDGPQGDLRAASSGPGGTYFLRPILSGIASPPTRLPSLMYRGVFDLGLASTDFGLRFSREVVFWDLAKAVPPRGVRRVF